VKTGHMNVIAIPAIGTEIEVADHLCQVATMEGQGAHVVVGALMLAAARKVLV
jgi:hypothetical protein